MKLSTKIISLMTLMAVLTGLIVGGVTLQLMSRSFDEYLMQTSKAEISVWEERYEAYYTENGNSWEGVQDEFSSSMVQTPYGVVRQQMELSVILIAPDGTILTCPDTESDKVGLKVKTRLLEHGYPIYEEGSQQLIGYLLPADYIGDRFWYLTDSYLADTRRSVVLGVVATIVLAIILGWIFARNLTRPLDKLILSVRRIAQGSTNEKVDIENDDEIGELALAFNQMSTELSRANDARVQMFADISHELRTPITAIAGTLENKLVKNEACSPEDLSALYDEMLRLGGMVTELQNISRLDAGHMPID